MSELLGVGMTSVRTRDRMISRLRDQGISNENVLESMRMTPRHFFVEEALAHRAYEDTALPIGWNQTLSQPYIVAKMSELVLAMGKPKRVLEIGSGSGYQSAVLAPLVGDLYSVERIKPILSLARRRLRKLKHRNVFLKHSDGFEGWPSNGPYDVILGAAAPESAPIELLKQLAPEGRLILPIGGIEQVLTVVTFNGDGFEFVYIEPVKFVPMLPGVKK